ncbi:MAG: hypothetical protein S4CHLAM102_04990 [Chlamydiia bacterium]|nr:hypothetical protein [Chlamydiia bacterium]
MSGPSPICLLFGSDRHYIDHIVPLASLLNLPIAITDESIYQSIQEQYPPLTLYYFPPDQVSQKLLEYDYNVVASCLPRPFLDKLFYFDMHRYQKRICNIWVPHGTSDKPLNNRHYEGLQHEDLLISTGPAMTERLLAAGIDEWRIIKGGNYRKAYYELHKSHFRPNLLSGKPRVLYAPTWNDYENGSSQSHLRTICQAIPDSYHFLCKLHPNTNSENPHLINTLNYPNLFFIEDYSPIYPLLDQSDIILLDNSSIGYDALYFEKPLYFITDKIHTPLHECGLCIHPDDIFSLLPQHINNPKPTWLEKQTHIQSLLKDTFYPTHPKTFSLNLQQKIEYFFDTEPQVLD